MLLSEAGPASFEYDMVLLSEAGSAMVGGRKATQETKLIFWVSTGVLLCKKVIQGVMGTSKVSRCKGWG